MWQKQTDVNYYKFIIIIKLLRFKSLLIIFIQLNLQVSAKKQVFVHLKILSKYKQRFTITGIFFNWRPYTKSRWFRVTWRNINDSFH